MKTFALVHRNVCLNVICDDEFENVIIFVRVQSLFLKIQNHPLILYA